MPTVVTSLVGCPRFSVSQAVSSGLCPGTCAVPLSALLVGGTDTSSRHWSPASPFPVTHSRVLRPRHGAVVVCPQEWCLVGLHNCLTFPRGAAAGPFVRGCETER
ncbi:hypothetical protein Taro_051824 [Colocasia esculenta]|uniref:Uncharacterized protein n=1 Tax=Colocasia esculenta TaxID=4460 RepID=A0A843XIF7_COLES|nr:hypothetical protein [Colocasia esculenta]